MIYSLCYQEVVLRLSNILLRKGMYALEEFSAIINQHHSDVIVPRLIHQPSIVFLSSPLCETSIPELIPLLV